MAPKKSHGTSPIGVFDAGPGGLAVVKQIIRQLPKEEIIYLADTARQPYGPRPIDEIQEFSLECIQWLSARGVKAVLIACNTASAALNLQIDHCSFPIPTLGIISPAIDRVTGMDGVHRIGIWGTEATVRTKAYDGPILARRPDLTVKSVACPELLRPAEKGQIDDRLHLKALAERYYRPLGESSIDVLILGCTDLTCLRDIIDEILPAGVQVVEPAEEIVRTTKEILIDKERLSSGSMKPPALHFHVTGENVRGFAEFAERFLGISGLDVRRVNLSPSIQRGLRPDQTRSE